MMSSLTWRISCLLIVVKQAINKSFKSGEIRWRDFPEASQPFCAFSSWLGALRAQFCKIMIDAGKPSRERIHIPPNGKLGKSSTQKRLEKGGGICDRSQECTSLKPQKMAKFTQDMVTCFSIIKQVLCEFPKMYGVESPSSFFLWGRVYSRHEYQLQTAKTLVV